MSKPFKLCILRLSAIGDVCHAVAMVNAIQRHRPNIEITWVIGKVEFQLLKGMSGVNFVIYDKKGGKQAKADVKEALGGTVFDALFVMQVALRANLLSTVIKAKKRVGFDWGRSKEGHFLFTNTRIKPQKHAHVLEGFMGFAETLGIPINEPPQWLVPIPAADLEWVEDQVSNLKPFAVISPAASKLERNWLPQRYAQIIDYLKVEKGIDVVLCGGPGELDKKCSDEILGYTENVDKNLVGKTNLKQMLGLLSKACMVIAPDTGPAHMATTQGVPVIGLYAHSNPRRTGPYGSLHHTVSVYEKHIEKQYGKTWEELPWGTRAKGSDLMSSISLEEVVQVVDHILANQEIN